ncbi:hypothetical protein ABGF49_08135 [Helcococcus ovis]|uniref:Uncharacterized protein n=1 Tax=Helcococcus ovis TaxID=72026 RepID=A0A4R9C357_9FIRM|nr:hypothetical protein [Helcococcus ovis]TFF66252.1 hypothetical protein EQF92_00750 [Helcococcus ovis]TFF67269.1 hypothetical protein EQF91_01200 [Helcococcus ovis]
MDTRDYIKKGSLVTLSAAVLFSQATVFAEEYKLNNSVQVYSEALNAKNRINSVRTYPKGKYYIFKKTYGMLNISKEENVEGLWINPKDNIELNINNLYDKSNIGDRYVLLEDVSGYINSDDALLEKNSVNSVLSGEYYIFNKSKGMINLTLDKDQPGTWINPKYNINIDNLSESIDLVKIESSLDGYMSSDDAKNSINGVTIVEPGVYHVYRSYNGMVNITMTKGEPGAWINPENIKIEKKHSKTTVKSEKIKYETKKNPVGDYTLREDTKGYDSLNEAKKQGNSVKTLPKGRYYVLESSNGMINLSKNYKNSGLWINPNENINKVKVSNFIHESVKSSNNKVEDVVDKYIKNGVSKEEIKDLGFDYDNILEKTKEKLLSEKKEEVVKVTKPKDGVKVILEHDKSDKAKETHESQKKISSEVKQEIATNSNSQINDFKDEVSLKDNIFSTNKSEKNKKSDKTDNIENKSDFKEKSEKNIEIDVSNIKITEPKENILDEEKTTVDSKFKKDEKFVLDKETDGYVRAEDALLKINKVNTLQPGEYFIYKTNSGMVNISREKNNLGMWINPK